MAEANSTRSCAQCGVSIEGKRASAIYCGKPCRTKHNRPERCASCAVCGSEFMSYRSTGAPGGWARCCSMECSRVARRLRDGTHRVYARAVHVMHFTGCIDCGVRQWRPSRGRFRCDACVAQQGWEPRERACLGCGAKFTQSARWQQRCAPDCVTPADRRQRREHRARRRAIERGAEADRIDPFVVFRRDGWTCQLCGEPTPRGLRGQMVSRAPELDHIIPLAMGGTHTWSNVQCACRECNGKKGATLVPVAA